MMRGKSLLEIVNQKFYLIFYGCIFWNLLVILILFWKEWFLISFVFCLMLILTLNINKLIEFGKINIYGDAHKKIIFLNLILLIMNIINIFFNVFRYIFNDIISWIRTYIRDFLLIYFKIEIPVKIDFYFENIVAYISFSNIWAIVSLMIFLIILYLKNLYFLISREQILFKNEQLRMKLFWTYRTQLLYDIYFFVKIFLVLFYIMLFFKDVLGFQIDELKFNFYVHFHMLNCLIFLIYNIQFYYNYYKFLWWKNEEYLKWK